MRYISASNWLSKGVRRIAGNNYHLLRLLYLFNLRRSWNRYVRSPVLIYQMGKVGSETIYRSLTALDLDMPINNIHFLKDADIEDVEKKVKSNFHSANLDLAHRLWLSQYIRSLLQKRVGNSGRPKWKIVTLVREPIARNLSAFFQFFKTQPLARSHKEIYRVKSTHHKFETIINPDDPEDINRLAELFFQRLNHQYPLRYFDLELKAVFGIDVFASDFPKRKGYKIYKEKQADVLLIRLENMRETARDAFKEFLNIDQFDLINTNISHQKDYAPIYKKFVSSVSIPKEYVREMYDSKYMRHFYSQEEINRFTAKWLNKRV